MKRLFDPVSDRKLKSIVHFTFGFVFLTSLLHSGVFGVLGEIQLIREAFLAGSGLLICISLCKTLFHEVMPALYIRYGSYVMALGYLIVIVNSAVVQVVPASRAV